MNEYEFFDLKKSTTIDSRITRLFIIWLIDWMRRDVIEGEREMKKYGKERFIYVKTDANPNSNS